MWSGKDCEKGIIELRNEACRTGRSEAELFSKEQKLRVQAHIGYAEMEAVLARGG